MRWDVLFINECDILQILLDNSDIECVIKLLMTSKKIHAQTIVSIWLTKKYDTLHHAIKKDQHAIHACKSYFEHYRLSEQTRRKFKYNLVIMEPMTKRAWWNRDNFDVTSERPECIPALLCVSDGGFETTSNANSSDLIYTHPELFFFYHIK